MKSIPAIQWNVYKIPISLPNPHPTPTLPNNNSSCILAVRFLVILYHEISISRKMRFPRNIVTATSQNSFNVFLLVPCTFKTYSQKMKQITRWIAMKYKKKITKRQPCERAGGQRHVSWSSRNRKLPAFKISNHVLEIFTTLKSVWCKQRLYSFV